LTHTSGYTYSLWNPLLAEYEAVTQTPFIGEARELALHAPLAFDPGERWEYGISMDQAGRIIEEVSGEDLETYTRNHVLDPLDLRDTGFVMSDEHRARLASVHARQPDGAVVRIPYDVPSEPEFFMGGGGAFSTPTDFMRLLRMFLGGGTLDGRRVLRPESVALMSQGAIGDLQTRPMVAADQNSAIVNDFDGLPGQRHTWGLSFDINQEPVPGGRAAGSIAWCGLLNLYYWVDFVSDVAGLFVTHMLPFPDGPAVARARQFERDVYASLQSDT
jgi:methyl acetate hydrolase